MRSKSRITIPNREAWLFQNKAAFASVQRRMAQAKQGKTHKLGASPNTRKIRKNFTLSQEK